MSTDKDVANESVSYDAKEEGIKKLVGYQPVKEGGFGFEQLVKHYTPEAPKQQPVVAKPSISFPSFSKGYGLATAYGGYGSAGIGKGYGGYSTGYGGSYGSAGISKGFGGQQAYGYGNKSQFGFGGYGVRNTGYGYGNQGSYGRSYGN